MTLVRHSDNTFDNARMISLGYEVVASETTTWPDGVTETELVWARNDAILASDVPF